jgi:hypothetical protein
MIPPKYESGGPDVINEEKFIILNIVIYSLILKFQDSWLHALTYGSSVQTLIRLLQHLRIIFIWIQDLPVKT